MAIAKYVWHAQQRSGKTIVSYFVLLIFVLRDNLVTVLQAMTVIKGLILNQQVYILIRKKKIKNESNR